MDSIVYIARQLSNICPSDSPIEADIAVMRAVASEVDARFEFLASRVKVLVRTGTRADPWHVMKHPIYLYLLSRALFESGMEDDSRIKDRLYCLNKALHGCSLFYKVRLPKVFFLNYATQIVMGDCVYGENLVVYQGVTVGGYREKNPVLGNNIVLMPNCIISGSTILGNNVVVSAGVVVINRTVPDNTLVFGGGKEKGGLVFHPLESNPYIDYFVSAINGRENV